MATGAIFAAIFLLAALGWAASAYRDGDFFQFRAGARAIAEGASPYDAAWSVAFHAREGSLALLQPPLYGSVAWTTPYPLWTFLVLIPFGAMPLGLSAASWLIFQLAGLAVALGTLTRSLGLARDRRALALLAAIVIAFEPT